MGRSEIESEQAQLIEHTKTKRTPEAIDITADAIKIPCYWWPSSSHKL